MKDNLRTFGNGPGKLTKTTASFLTKALTRTGYQKDLAELRKMLKPHVSL